MRDIPVFVVLLGVVKDLLQALTDCCGTYMCLLTVCVIGTWMDSQVKRGDFSDVLMIRFQYRQV